MRTLITTWPLLKAKGRNEKRAHQFLCANLFMRVFFAFAFNQIFFGLLLLYAKFARFKAWERSQTFMDNPLNWLTKMDEIRCRVGREWRTWAESVSRETNSNWWFFSLSRSLTKMTNNFHAKIKRYGTDTIRVESRRRSSCEAKWKMSTIRMQSIEWQNCFGRLLLTRVFHSKYLGGRQIVPFVSGQMHLTGRNRMVSIRSENDLLLRCCEHDLSSTSLLAWQTERSAGVETQNKYIEIIRAWWELWACGPHHFHLIKFTANFSIS